MTYYLEHLLVWESCPQHALLARDAELGDVEAVSSMGRSRSLHEYAIVVALGYRSGTADRIWTAARLAPCVTSASPTARCLVGEE